MRSRFEGHGAAWLVAAITLLGLALRLRMLGNSLFGDELSTYSIVTGRGPSAIVSLLDGHSVDLTPPLSFLLAWLATRLGRSPETLRLFPLLAGTATIPLTYLVGARLLSRAAASCGALLVALSPFLIFFSTEARAYAVVTALALTSTLALLQALRSSRRGWWALYAVASCAAVYTHYTALFVLLAQAGWALALHRERAAALLGANLVAAVGFAPWLPALVRNTHSFGTKIFELLDPFGWHAISHDVARWAVGHPFLALTTDPGAVGIVLIAAGVIAGAVLGRPSPSPGGWLVALLALATPVGLALYSVLGTDTWDVRNLICSWPGLALAMGALAVAPRGRWRAVTIGAVTVGYAIGAVNLLTADHQRPDYAAAAHLILAHGRSDSVAIIAAPTPGPYAAMDASLDFAGDPGRSLLRIGSPPLAEIMRAAPYAPLAPPPPGQLAAETSGAELFVVAPGTVPLASLLRSGVVNARHALGPVFGTGINGRLLATVYVPLSAYLRAVATRYTAVSTVHLPGFMPLSVYVLRRHPSLQSGPP